MKQCQVLSIFFVENAKASEHLVVMKFSLIPRTKSRGQPDSMLLDTYIHFVVNG